MMHSNESVTVIVPVFNRPVLVKRCLESLKAQTWRPLNVIVVDNASTDNTLEVLAHWKKVNEEEEFNIELLNENQKGAAFARQKGLEHCLSDKVMFLDSDDSMRPEAVAILMNEWKNNPDAAIVAWPVSRFIDGRKFRTHSIRGNLLERHLVHSIFLTVGYASKTFYLRSIGGWRGQFLTWDDLELGTRVLLPKPDVIALQTPLVDVYPQDESITGTNFASKSGLWEKSLDGIKKSIEESGRADIPRLLNIVSYRRAILAADYAKEERNDLAKPLYLQALGEVPKLKRPLIRFAYYWTRMHLRGAFHIVGPFL